MSVFDKILQEHYPHSVDVYVCNGLKFAETKKAITEWCQGNIYEYDISLLYRDRSVCGYKINCTNIDDWLLAKIRWSGC